MFIKLSLALLIATSSLSAEDLLYPVDVTVDDAGNIYVADHEAHALLALRGGTYEVVARGEGRPRTPLYGIRHATASGNGFIVSDPATMKLYRVSAAGAIEAVADDDRFVTPWGLAVETTGSILAVDRVTHRLRRVEPDGTVEDVAEIRAPRAVLFDKEGGIVVLTDQTLVRVASPSGAVTPIVESTPFEFPHDAVLHPDGSFYVTDGYARAIWRVTSDGTISALVQGDPLVSPQGIAVDGEGNLLVADAHARAVFKVSTKGELSKLP